MKNHASGREFISRIPGIFFICLASVTFNFAQTKNPPGPLKLGEAVDLALANYPAIKTAQAQATVAEANIELSRTVYLPRLDFLGQENRVTRNNFFGVILPQSIVPSISGPVLSDTSMESAFGSAGGTLLSWEPFDFGARNAQVNVARVGAKQAHANEVATELDVAASAADAFMALAASQAGVRAAEANVARAQVFADSVHVLVNNQLRAGADAERADAELSLAKIQLLKAEQTAETNRAALAQALGVAGTNVTIETDKLMELPDDTSTPIPQFENHPAAVDQKLAIDLVRAREKVLARSYVPKFYLQGSFSGRGTGALTNGEFAGGLHGLWPTIPNYGVGLTVTFPAFDIFSIRARRHIEAGNEAVEKSRYDQTIQTLTGQYAQAATLVNWAVKIAQETPSELKSAREAERLVRERYKYGLATVTDVADAQRLLAQAEIDDAVARLNVWRALLIAARVEGDLKPVLQRIH